MRTPGEDSQRSLRAVGGLICPRCRTKGEFVPRADGKLPRCAACSFALVSADALADADGDPFLGATVASRFVVLARLGAGSMGTVYRARQEAMGRDVAIKILRSDRAFDAQAKARFTREARAMSLLASPHTVTVFDFGEIPDDDDLGRGASLYLAMELLEGESLGGRLKRLKRLPFEQAVRIARHTLLSLAEAHEKGVIHRDLKPDNLFLAKGAGEEVETCKVLDFGIAKVVSDAPAVDALETQAGTVFGTPRYMSPEQAQGKPLDARSDLYSLAVLLYQMLVGRPPFVDDDAVVVMARHIKTPPIAPNAAGPELGIPAALSDLVVRALSKDPKDRPRSARALIAELDAAVARAPSERPRGAENAATVSGQIPALSRDDLDPPNTSSRRRRRSIAKVAFGVALAVGAVVIGVSAFRGQGAVLVPAEAGVARHAAAPLVEAAASGRARAAPRRCAGRRHRRRSERVRLRRPERGCLDARAAADEARSEAQLPPLRSVTGSTRLTASRSSACVRRARRDLRSSCARRCCRRSARRRTAGNGDGRFAAWTTAPRPSPFDRPRSSTARRWSTPSSSR